MNADNIIWTQKLYIILFNLCHFKTNQYFQNKYTHFFICYIYWRYLSM